MLTPRNCNGYATAVCDQLRAMCAIEMRATVCEEEVVRFTQNPGNKNGERNTRLAEHRHWTSRFTLCFHRLARWHSPCCCQRLVLWFRPRWTATYIVHGNPN